LQRLRSLLSALKPTRLGVLYAVLVGLGVGFWQWNRPPQPRVVLGKFGEGSSVRVHFSPDACKVVTVHHKQPPDIDYHYLTLWDAQTGQKEFDFFTGKAPTLADPAQAEDRRRLLIGGVVFSPTGQLMACIFEKHNGVSEVSEKQIRVWDVFSGKELAIFQEKDGFPQLVFTSEGKLLVLRENSVLWNVADNKIVKKLVSKGEEIIGRRVGKILVRSQGNIVKVWDLAAATLVAERQDILRKDQPCNAHPGPVGVEGPLPVPPKDLSCNADWISDCFLLLYQVDTGAGFIRDLATGEKNAIPFMPQTAKAVMSPDGKTIAVEAFAADLPDKSWWTEFMHWLGKPREVALDNWVTLNAFPSDEEIIALEGYRSPVFSPDGETLAVMANDGSLQLWDLPIRKPIGKILGLTALAAVATLLAINDLGWLRRRKMRLKANLDRTQPGTGVNAVP
jgi:WD40 repeat protein